jgi:hypothetical protein
MRSDLTDLTPGPSPSRERGVLLGRWLWDLRTAAVISPHPNPLPILGEGDILTAISSNTCNRLTKVLPSPVRERGWG